MINAFINELEPGDLVVATRPDFQVPEEDTKKLGLVLGLVPKGHLGNSYLITQILVMWTGPHDGDVLSLEPDHRLLRVQIKDGEC